MAGLGLLPPAGAQAPAYDRLLALEARIRAAPSVSFDAAYAEPGRPSWTARVRAERIAAYAPPAESVDDVLSRGNARLDLVLGDTLRAVYDGQDAVLDAPSGLRSGRDATVALRRAWLSLFAWYEARAPFTFAAMSPYGRLFGPRRVEVEGAPCDLVETDATATMESAAGRPRAVTRVCIGDDGFPRRLEWIRRVPEHGLVRDEAVGTLVLTNVRVGAAGGVFDVAAARRAAEARRAPRP